MLQVQSLAEAAIDAGRSNHSMKWATTHLTFLLTFSVGRVASICGQENPEDKIHINDLNGTLASFISTSPSYSAITREVMNHFKKVSRLAVQESRRNEEQYRSPGYACISLSDFGIPTQSWGNALHCKTHMIGELSHPGFSPPAHIFTVLHTFVQVVHSLAPRWVRSYHLPWNDTFSSMAVSFNADRYRRCTSVRVSGLRCNITMFISPHVTNLTATETGKTRGQLQEYLALDENRIVAFRKRSNGLPGGAGRLFTRKNRASTSHYEGMYSKDSQSSILALSYGQVEKIKIQESDSVSTLALLFIPAILSVIPLGLFQEASLSVMVLYAVATDFLSVLPIAVQGVELLLYGSRKHFSYVSDISNDERQISLEKFATSVTKCEANPSVWRRGAIFVALAAILMTCGFAFEILSRRKLSRKTKERAWSGPGLLDEAGYRRALRLPQRQGSIFDGILHNAAFEEDGSRCLTA